ncbi:MAG: hypothetical protein RPS47_02000 [Colwellia sp.]
MDAAAVTTITSAVDFTTIVTGIGAIAAIPCTGFRPSMNSKKAA